MRRVALTAILAMTAAACGHTGPRAYVTNESSGDLSIIDLAKNTVVGTIPLGKRPRGVKASPDGRLLFVALSGSPVAGPGVDESTLPPPDRSADGIGVVDVGKEQLLRMIGSGPDPEQLAVTADNRLVIANEDAARATIIDASKGTVVKEVPVGSEPEGVTVDPGGREVWVTSEADGQVFAIDTSSYAVIAKIDVGHRPRSVAFLPDGSRAFVTCENDAAVSVVDARQHQFVKQIALSDRETQPRARPMGIVASPDGSAVYVSTGSFGRVFVVDTATDRPVASIDVGKRPWGIAVTRDGKTLYTANGPSNDVSVVDIASRRVLKRIPVGDKPWGIVLVGPNP